MVNKNTVLEFMRQDSYHPLSYNDLMEVFEIQAEEEGKFARVLGTLEKQGEIIKTRKKKYGLPDQMNLAKGVINLSQRGYGFIILDEPDTPDIFVYGRNLNGAMHHDKVLVRVYQHSNGNGNGNGESRRPEGEVVRVINRANKELVGTFERGRHSLQVIPDDSRQIYPITVSRTRKLKVNPGDKVLVSITSWPDKKGIAEGKILEVLGKKGQPGLDVQVIIKKHGLASEFPESVVEEAVQASAQPISESELLKRLDLRNISMVTIDGEDAKDLDDAVSVERIAGGYRLGVHIADVSHYVREDSKLDKEACKRGTSVYLINKVLPMLPPQLSNDICSLNAKQDRLALSCIMDIDQQGQVFNYEIRKSVINVKERMTYSDVNKILAGEEGGLKERYRDYIENFFLMKELADIIRAERMARGMLDFDFPESKVIVDDNGVPIEIKRREQGDGEKLIEDFMIKANETVAAHMYGQELPILYRVHENPDEDALVKLNHVLGVFGHQIKGRKIQPRLFQKVLEDIKGRPEEQMISLMILRSMKHARYVPQALGHFGLASEYYCHFTSPIRRYPDLIVHRVLSLMLAHGISERKKASLTAKMAEYGEHSTLQEIKAEEAERELVSIKKAQYMEPFVGEEFTGKISSVLSFGFFVELPNTVEGLVHISSIADDYYVFNDRNYTLLGNHTGRKFAIGDPVKVLLAKVDVNEAKIDFELIP
ncbi:3'-to-5' exoribonuclease rnase r [hydrocarbon metagenome]|uniref:exoribonuclease II n=1 Tax=hydrocarbon metagenome TaxID=938273 RepID=A0A0W8E5X1_9ZZZZ